MILSSVDADKGQVAPHPAMISFRMPMWSAGHGGGLGTLHTIRTWAERWWQESGKRRTRCWALPSSLGRLTSSAPAAEALGPHMSMEWSLKPGYSRWLKVMAIGMWQEHAEPHGSSVNACWTSSWGSSWNARGSTYVERSLNAGSATELKVNGGQSTGACWAPWQFTGIDGSLHVPASTRGLGGKTSRSPACQDHPVGMAELSCSQELKIKPCWKAWSNHIERQAMCWKLFLLVSTSSYFGQILYIAWGSWHLMWKDLHCLQSSCSHLCQQSRG